MSKERTLEYPHKFTLSDLISHGAVYLKEAIKNLRENLALKKSLEDQISDDKAYVFEIMKKEGIEKEKIEGMKLAYVKESKSTSFDHKTARLLLEAKGVDPKILDYVWGKSMKESKRSEYLRIS